MRIVTNRPQNQDLPEEFREGRVREARRRYLPESADLTVAIDGAVERMLDRGLFDAPNALSIQGNESESGECDIEGGCI